ncbi:MAG: polyphosphate kinase 2 family protein [Planctomycetes bacterium]|nr:polyphosphate kinase 2 family protein [Planctomycetota bacterium]
MKKMSRILSAMRFDKKGAVDLAAIDTGSTEGVADKERSLELLRYNCDELASWQYKLYAEAKRGLLLVFQAMDTAGKDGVIRKVFGPLNPQGVVVTPFKQPSSLEAAHDYLWRVHSQVPAKGMVRIFNRSHYEDVLVHRVRKLTPRDALEKRYGQINDFERYLTENDVVILKFFLHISKDEQKRRLESRLKQPDKRWKFSVGDIEERKLWGKYQDAYQLVLERCSTKYAPWYVIPADHKWYRDWAVSEIVLHTLRELHPEFPRAQPGLDDLVVV